MWDNESQIRKCEHPGCSYEVKHKKEDAGYCSKPKFPHWNTPVLWGLDYMCECGSRKTRLFDPHAPYFHAHYCPSIKNK